MIKKITIEEKLNLIKTNVLEVITEQELIGLLKKKNSPVVYCGYEPNGPLHLGHFVTITKLMELSKLGFKVIILLADIHALLNRKGSSDEIKKEVQNWIKTIKAMGLEAEIVLGSDFQFKKDYQIDIMNLAQNSTISRGLRSMQEIARDIENATISQLWYPLMQIADIKHLKVDIALGGLEQRKVHMLGRDLSGVLKYNFIALHTPLITSLKGPGQKMSKSIPGSGISVIDSKEEIKKTLKNAYCPEGIIQDNPILQIMKLIIFPRYKKIEIKRSEKYGGNLFFNNYKELEKVYVEKKLHPSDLKDATEEYLEKIISPIRKNYK